METLLANLIVLSTIQRAMLWLCLAMYFWSKAKARARDGEWMENGEWRMEMMEHERAASESWLHVEPFSCSRQRESARTNPFIATTTNLPC